MSCLAFSPCIYPSVSRACKLIYERQIIRANRREWGVGCGGHAVQASCRQRGDSSPALAVRRVLPHDPSVPLGVGYPGKTGQVGCFLGRGRVDWAGLKERDSTFSVAFWTLSFEPRGQKYHESGSTVSWFDYATLEIRQHAKNVERPCPCPR